MISKKTFPFPLGPLFLLVAIFYLSFVARIIFAPLLPVVERDLSLGHGQAGSLFFFVAAGYGAGLLGSGFVSSLLSHRGTITLSIMMVGAALFIISGSASLNGIHGGLFLIGLFAGFYLPSGLATLTNMTSREHWGKAMAIHELAPNLAFVTAPFLSEALLKLFSWRQSLATLGICSILMGVLFLFLGWGGREKGELPRLKAVNEVVMNPPFWVMTTMFTVSIGSSLGVYTMMPLFLVSEMGMDRGWANTLIGLSRTFGIVVLFISGFIADRFGPKQALTLFLTTTAIFTLLLGLIQGAVTTPVWIFLQAASTACLFPVGFTLLSLIFPTHLRSIALSLVILVGFLLGGGVIPSAIGHWAEAFSFSSGFFLLGVFFMGMLPLFLRVATRLNLSE
ncbi:MAG: MFS transporter [Deltaproteobacteria bacterium]|nr:MFS transporter [Deltaproteobacteria bacterium]